jgi:hypothetical protein
MSARRAATRRLDELSRRYAEHGGQHLRPAARAVDSQSAATASALHRVPGGARLPSARREGRSDTATDAVCQRRRHRPPPAPASPPAFASGPAIVAGRPPFSTPRAAWMTPTTSS